MRPGFDEGKLLICTLLERLPLEFEIVGWGLVAKSKHFLTEIYPKGHVQPVSGPTMSNHEGLCHGGFLNLNLSCE